MTTLQGFSRDYLAALFDYDTATGVVRRRVTRSHNARAGQVVGSFDGKGYMHVCIDGKFVRLHRLGYFLATGLVPAQIDHIDRCRGNNALANLRPITCQHNAGNSGVHRHNTSGYRGVSQNASSGKWHAQIKLHGKQTYLGRFDSPEEAARRYNAAAAAHFGEFATLNKVPQ